MADCVVFIGIPASGKTTFYQRRFLETHVHVSKDLWPHARNKEARQLAIVRESLLTGASVVVDNTHPSPSDRAGVIAAARDLGARVIGYYFDASTRDAVGRNRGREGRARVPDVAIFTKAKRMVVPSPSEGFDELYRVSITETGDFDVRPLVTRQ